MINHFRYRAHIDRLWRRATSDAPAYRRLRDLNALVRECFAPTDRARRNYETYLAADPFDVARHKLRDLYDHAAPGQLIVTPAPLPVTPAQAGAATQEEEPPDEDDDPL